MAKLTRYTAQVEFTYDPEADAAYIYLGDQPRIGCATFGATSDIFIDVDFGGSVIGIELLGGKLLPVGMRKAVGLK